MRLFTAIVPPVEVLEHLSTALPPAPPGVRWTHPDTWHVTLAFHGEVPGGTVPDLTEALRTRLADAVPLTLALAGAGSFAGRALWVGVAEEDAGTDGSGSRPAADGLVERVRAAAADAGLPVEARERSRLHLTVGRTTARSFGGRPRERSRRSHRERDTTRPAGPTGSDAVVHALAVYRGPGFVVDEVCLIESRLGEGPGGTPRHLVLERVGLGSTR